MAERAKENFRFENSVDRLNKNKVHKVKTYTIVATDKKPFNSVTAVLLKALVTKNALPVQSHRLSS